MVLLEKLIVPKLVKKLSAFCETPNFDHRIYNIPPLVPVLSHINLVHAPASCIMEVYFNIIIPPTRSSS
jgi:hypothetical protein